MKELCFGGRAEPTAKSTCVEMALRPSRSGQLAASVGPATSRRVQSRTSKLDGALPAEVPSASPAAAQSKLPRREAVVDKRSVAIELLKDGYVQSFVDFFDLMHKDKVQEGESAPASTVVSSPSDLLYVRGCLASAETATRHQDKGRIMQSYGKLADYFVDRERPHTALLFRSRATEVARLSSDPLEEPRALLALSLTQMREDNSAGAVKTLEECLDLVAEHMTATTHTEGVKTALRDIHHSAGESLLVAYARASAQSAEAGELAEALVAELKALQLSQELGNKPQEARAQLSAGRLCLGLEQASKALPYLKSFVTLYLAEEERGTHLDNYALGFIALAEAYSKSGRRSDSLRTLREYADAGERSGDHSGVADARQRLGEAMLLGGDASHAVNELSSSYGTRRALLVAGTADRSSLAKVRISLGLARGQLALDGLLRSVQHDVSGLLKWKAGRDAAALEAKPASSE
jgi:tetratricopeptide (TPR) repeat protein